MRTIAFSKVVLLALLMSAMPIVSKADLVINSENFPDRLFRAAIAYGLHELSIYPSSQDGNMVLTDEQVKKLTYLGTPGPGFTTSEGIHLLPYIERVDLAYNWGWYDNENNTIDSHLDLSQCYNLKRLRLVKNYIYFYLPDHEFEFTDCRKLFGLTSTRGVALDEEKCYDLSRYRPYGFEPDRIRNLTGAEIVGDKMKFTHRRAFYEYNCSKTAERWLKFCIFNNDLSLPEHPEFFEYEMAFDSASEVPEILTDDKGRDYVVIKVAEFKEKILQVDLNEAPENVDHNVAGSFVIQWGAQFYLNYENTWNDFFNAFDNYTTLLKEEFFAYDETLDIAYYKVYFPEDDGFKYNPIKSYPISFLYQFGVPGCERYDDYYPTNIFCIHSSNRLIIPASVSENSIEVERQNSPTEYYTLQGIRLRQKPTIPGIYIVRKGGETKKIVIK